MNILCLYPRHVEQDRNVYEMKLSFDKIMRIFKMYGSDVEVT